MAAPDNPLERRSLDPIGRPRPLKRLEPLEVAVVSPVLPDLCGPRIIVQKQSVPAKHSQSLVRDRRDYNTAGFAARIQHKDRDPSTDEKVTPDGLSGYPGAPGHPRRMAFVESMPPSLLSASIEP